MPLRPELTRVFHRCLYAGQLEELTLYKRNDDQKEGTVTTYQLYDCRHSLIYRTGQALANDMESGSRTTWHIPRIELERIGISYLSPLDMFKDKRGRTWIPEAPTQLTHKLWESHVCLDCRQRTQGAMTPFN